MERCGPCPATDQQDPSTVYQVNDMDSVRICYSRTEDLAQLFWVKVLKLHIQIPSDQLRRSHTTQYHCGYNWRTLRVC